MPRTTRRDRCPVLKAAIAAACAARAAQPVVPPTPAAAAAQQAIPLAALRAGWLRGKPSFARFLAAIRSVGGVEHLHRLDLSDFIEPIERADKVAMVYLYCIRIIDHAAYIEWLQKQIAKYAGEEEKKQQQRAASDDEEDEEEEDEEEDEEEEQEEEEEAVGEAAEAVDEVDEADTDCKRHFERVLAVATRCTGGYLYYFGVQATSHSATSTTTAISLAARKCTLSMHARPTHPFASFLALSASTLPMMPTSTSSRSS